MKQLLLSCLFIALAFQQLTAQQIPLYTQYYNNEFLYNPSQTLTEVSPTLSLLYRKQWVQLEGPTTRALFFQAPLKAEKIGIGLQLYSDRFAIFDQTGGKVSYSYQVDLSSGGEHKVLLGLAAGFLQTNFVWDPLFISTTNDPTILERIGDKTSVFDADFGFTYVWKDLEVGMAVPHLLENDANFLSVRENLLFYPTRHFLGTASYKFGFGDNMSIRPLFMARYHPSVPFQFDVNAIFDYQNKLWLAASYRHDYGYSAAFGVNLHERLNLGYSYDIMSGDLSSFGGSTHEIVVSLKLGRSSDMKTPEEKEIEIEKQQTLDDLKLELAKLKKRIKEQADTLTDHESRIQALENSKDSLADIIREEVRKQIESESIGSGSYDVRDPNSSNPENFVQRRNKIINPEDPEAPYGRKKDGTPIGENEVYDGEKYNKKGEVITGKGASQELYDVNGNKIKDIDNYVGPIYNAEGEKIAENKPRPKTGTGTRGGGGTSGSTGTKGGGTSGDGGSSDGGSSGGTGSSGSRGGSDGSSYTGKTYTKAELINDGIKYTAPGNYLIIASFRGKENALRQLQQMEENGQNGGIVYNHYRNWFYVYTLESKDFEETLTALRKARAGADPDAWVHVILD